MIKKGQLGEDAVMPSRKRLNHRGPLSIDIESAWYFITICAEGHRPWMMRNPDGRAGAHPALSPLRGLLRSEDIRTPLASSSDDDLPVWNLARHRAAVEHVLTKTAISEQSRRIYRELLATGDSCAKVARRMNLPAATVRQVKSRVSRMIAAFEKATK